MNITNHGRSTIVDWLAMYRRVCSLSFENDPLMILNTEDTTKFYVYYFIGRRKYGRGRTIQEYCATLCETEAREEEDRLSSMPSYGEENQRQVQGRFKF